MGKKLGIDLGTTYSCISYLDENGQLITINSSDGTLTTPSVVYLDPDSQTVIVGATARQEGAMNPSNMIERAKNYMGTDFTFDIGDQQFSPTAVSAAILKQLIKDAEENLGGEPIDGVVITCPAYFKDPARNATRMAGESIELSNGEKLKVLQILDEPVAAAVAYAASLNQDLQKTIMVYDLGGGTFDVTIVKINICGDDKKVQIVTTEGDHQLGGKDWDEALKAYVVDEFCSATGTDRDELLADEEMRVWFSEQIEKTKKALSQRDSTNLTVNFNGERAKIEVTREKFDEVTSEKLQITIALVEKILTEKNMTMDQIDEILLVGSSTRMPQVEERLAKEYGRPIRKFEQERAVSIGAAYIASGYQLSETQTPPTGEPGEGGNSDPSNGSNNGGADLPKMPVDPVYVCTSSFGLLATYNGEEIVANIVMKDAVKPAKETQSFVTSALGQTSLSLRVFENDSREQIAPVNPDEELFETCVVELEPGLPANAPINITFDISVDGTLDITAEDVTRGTFTTVRAVRKNADKIGGGLDEINKFQLG